jgi:hypothetical protein
MSKRIYVSVLPLGLHVLPKRAVYTQTREDIHLSPYTRHIIAENGASSFPNIVALSCSKAGAGKFFVSASATILLVLHCTSLTSE